MKKKIAKIISKFVPRKLVRTNPIYQELLLQKSNSQKHIKQLGIKLESEQEKYQKTIEGMNRKLIQTNAKLKESQEKAKLFWHKMINQSIFDVASNHGVEKAEEEIELRFSESMRQRFVFGYQLGISKSKFLRFKEQLFDRARETGHYIILKEILRVCLVTNNWTLRDDQIMFDFFEQTDDLYILPYYMSYCIENKKESELRKIESLYTYDYSSGPCFLSIIERNFALGRLRMITPRLEKALVVFRYFKKGKYDLSDMASAKTIAIVANSPSEIGLNRGGEIDSHENVVRFNNYFHNQELEKDYGKKIDTWVSALTSTLEVEEDPPSSFVVTGDPFLDPIDHKTLNTLYDYFLEHNPSIYLTKKAKKSASISADVLMPSSGLVAVWMFREQLSDLKLSTYGFELTDQVTNWSKRHYNNSSKNETYKGCWHNWISEKKFMKTILGKN